MTDFIQRGGCQCGNIRYTLTKTPHVIYCCHCTECQKQSSSAFGISVRVDTSAVEISGEPKTFTRPSASGPMDCLFCPDCGTRLFHRRSTYGETMNIKGGTFDNTRWIKPAGHIWTASKQTWVLIPESDLSYPHQPANYDALEKAWRTERGLSAPSL